MNITKRLLITFIIQMFFLYPLRAEHYYYKQISLKAGLPSTVHCIAADNRGFVWMGTRSGLPLRIEPIRIETVCCRDSVATTG